MCGCYHCIKDLTFYKTGDKKTIHGSLIEDSKYASLLYINLDMAFHWNANSVDTFDLNNYKLNRNYKNATMYFYWPTNEPADHFSKREEN